MTIYKRDNIQNMYGKISTEIKGVPMFYCDKCLKRYRTKGQAKNHKCKIDEKK